jgi:hypothetical protein
MKEISIQNFINSLKITIPSESEFLKLSRITPVNPKYSERGIVNFERGMLLYSLITKYKPKTVLEIGTAEGYSTLCMAWAMTENKIEGKIYTIDPKSHDLSVERTIILEDGETITEKLSTKELWDKFASPEWLKKIEVISGYAGEILNSKKFPKMEFGYIDGAHFYEAVKHDFFGFLKIADKKFSILFDDYITGKKDGVSRVIEEEVVNNFNTTFIKTDAKKHRKKIGIEISGDEQVMCFIQSDSLKDNIWKVYSKEKIEEYIKNYLILEKRIKIRKKLDKKIPYLKNIKFQWWKK